MNLLAIETATESCSVALLYGDTVIDRSEVAPRRHAERVLPMAESLLAEAGLGRRQLDAIAVGRGPGAFTGVRLGVSMAQGLGLALDVPVATVSSLAALAMEAEAGPGPVLALIDARMGEIYAGAFSPGVGGLLEPLGSERVCPPEALAEPPALGGWRVVGSGWGTYGDVLAARLGQPASAVAERYPQARHVARLARPLLDSGADLAPEHALPVYLRDKVALTLTEQGRA